MAVHVRGNHEQVPLLHDLEKKSDGEERNPSDTSNALRYSQCSRRISTRSSWCFGSLVVVLFISLRLFLHEALPMSQIPLSEPLNICDRSRIASFQETSWLPSQKDPERCSFADFSAEHNFGFNVSSDKVTESTFSLLDTAVPSSNNILVGEIRVQRGNESQSSDIEVYVVLRSNDRKGVAAVVFENRNNTLAMSYHEPRPAPLKTICTQVELVISLRPYQKHTLNRFVLQTEMLTVDFGSHLQWTINNLLVNATHGDVLSRIEFYDFDDEPLVAHNHTISVVQGNMLGGIVPSNLTINAQHGTIRIGLAPNLTPGAAPFNPESITITSMSIIEVYTVYFLWPTREYTHRTQIETTSVVIAGVFIHGRYTNLTSNGTLYTALFVFDTDDEERTSELYTDSRGAPTCLNIFRANGEWRNNNKFNSLANLVSEHHVASGSLELGVDPDWAGELEATVEEGTIEMEEDKWDVLESREGYRRARRAEYGKSRMHVHVETGDFQVVLKDAK